MRAILIVFAAMASFMVPNSALAATYYVAPTGNDSAPGTESKPWKRIQKAANTAKAGDIVLVRGGIYNERVTINVSGSPDGGYITFKNFEGEVATLDGTGLIVPDADNGMFLIKNQSYITVQGFEIRDYKTAVRYRVPIGINIRGTSHHIKILKNKIHHIETNYPGKDGGDAHGIAVYGTSATSPIRDLIIEANELYALKLGSSEALVLNGNVSNFQVRWNKIHDCNNIGIDFIGHEKTCSDPAQDQARDGVCRHNLVYNIDTYGNPAYGNSRSAGGIYVDGGTRIVIERNTVHHCNIGIELASEHAGKSTSHITLRSNMIYNSHLGGILIGGYDTKRGSTENCKIYNNTLFQNGECEFMLQYDTRNNEFKNNILFVKPGSPFIYNSYTKNTGNVLNYNLYFAAAGATKSEFEWKNQYYTGFEKYRTATGNDKNSIFADPKFVSIKTGSINLHLQKSSPAIDAGDPARVLASGELDIDRQPRLQGASVDIGADEVAPTP
jgi:hypothetical protein